MSNPEAPRLAVQYIRMSTDRQDLSPEIQAKAMKAYADDNGIEILDTYLDGGKSGLTIEQRPALRKLLDDAADRKRSFGVILVYDVSRWGRFPDIDQAAYHEFHCKKNGVEVIYTEELFTKDTSPYAALHKNFRRAAASDFSRDLSKKTTAGQVQALQNGYHLGTMPCLGFSRVAVSKADGSERLLEPREYKAGRAEHLRWILGAEEEVQAVRRIFELYANTEINIVKLGNLLHAEGLKSSRGRPITHWSLYTFLRCEAVVGNFVWGRATKKKKRKEGDPRFHRVEGFAEPIVSRELWERVQAKLNRRAHFHFSERDLIDRLRAVLQIRPKLRASELKAFGCATHATYKTKFGSLENAWAAAGATYPSIGETDYTEMTRMQRVGARTCTLIFDRLVEAGVECTRYTRADRQGSRLLINGSVVLRVQAIFRRPRRGIQTWKRRRVYSDYFDWALIIRIEDDGRMVDSLLMRRDQYFERGMWLEDDLSASGEWSFHEDMGSVVRLFASLEPALQGSGAATKPNHRSWKGLGSRSSFVT